MAILELQNIKKVFSGNGGFLGQAKVVRAVDGVDLSINAGENFGIVGESGSGKSTLARVAMKLYPTTGGRLIFDGEDYTNYSRNKLRGIYQKMQMVFQDPYSSLDPRMSVRDILLEPMDLVKAQYPTVKNKIDKISEALKSVGLNAEMLNRYPHEFSGGERQRLAIARALVVEPKVLILDEAVSSLDVITQAQVIELLGQLKRKYQLTYIFISHNLKVVRQLCDRIMVMYKGKVVELAPAEALFKNPLHQYTQELLASAVNFKSVSRQEDIIISDSAALVDKGGGHFVRQLSK